MLDPAQVAVRDIMTRAVHTVAIDARLSDAARELLTLSVSALPVVDEAGRPVGVLSLRDLVRALGPAPATHAADEPTVYYGTLAHEELRVLLADLDLEGLEGAVRTQMTPTVIACAAETSVRDAARMMASRGIHRVMVVDGEERLAGVVSAMDVVAFVARDAA
jgi:CBS domain-containing protein